jgi:RNA polymerase sigma-70 factor (ECF subfamily)
MKQDAKEPHLPSAGGAGPVRPEHLDQLYRRESTKLRNWLRRQGVPREELDDVAHEAFAKLAGIPASRSVGYLRAYLYKTALRVWLNRCRTRSVHQRKVPTVGFDGLEPHPSPENFVIDQTVLAALGKVIETLPPRKRMVLQLWCDGVPPQAIAAQLAARGIEVSMKTVRRDIKETLAILIQTVASEQTKQERSE